MINKEKIEKEWDEFCENISDLIERGDIFELKVEDFEKWKEYIKNWDVVLEVIREENEEGYSEKWNNIELIWWGKI
jgi:hypothetical protein